MKLCFQISFEQKHLLIKDGSNVILVDTGSPITIHTSNTLEFGGTSYKVTTNAMGNTIEELQKISGVEFTTLMGMDIISKYKVIFDYANQEITFCTFDEPNPNGAECPLKLSMGTLIVPVVIKGIARLMILDTGATYSYLQSSLTHDLQPKETITDFSPLVGGEFTTPIFEIESEFGDTKFLCNYGNLPTTIQTMISLLGVQGIIGYDLLRSVKLMINIPENKMILVDRE